MARAWLALALALAGVMSVSSALQELPGYKTQFEVLKAGDGRSAGNSLRAAINLRLLPLAPPVGALVWDAHAREQSTGTGRCTLLAHFLTVWCVWCCAERCSRATA
jgi:hypothetical protein